MMPEPREIDRLIEEGLLLYGQGDLDQALMIWEQALSIDPENPQANSYVDYVRMNYELLTNETGGDEPGSGFGLDDEEPYKVEVAPGEIATAGTPASADPADEGWFIAGEAATRGAVHDGEPGPEPPTATVHIEADEPPAYTASHLVPDKPVSFDDTTREYPKGSGVLDENAVPSFLKHLTDPGLGLPERAPASTPEAGTASAFAVAPAPGPPPDFESDHTDGFGATQLTDVRKRELGFVQPRAELPLKPPPEEAPEEPPQRSHRKTSPPPELKMTLRTPEMKSDADTVTPDFHGGSDKRQSSTQAPTAELDPREPGPRMAIELAAAALVDTLPTPLRSSRSITPISMPPPPPQPAIAISKAPTTRMMSGEISIPDIPIEPHAPTRELPSSVLPFRDDPLVSAPTRELGLRTIVPMRTEHDNEPTKDLGHRKKALVPNVLVAEEVGSATRHDLVLPFDPIDARSAQILAAVDAGAPEDENKEDRTRRRITLLLDRATEWARTGEADKAVAAVDLALGEDPNAALGQKLLHRNRDTIMTIFQGYLGDLERTPVLAKPLHELAKTPISPRAAFLLSRVDGALTIDEILDVSGMPRLEAYRYLCQLLLRGILR